MKKYVTTFVMTSMLAVMVPFFAQTAAAQSRYYGNNRGRVVRVAKGRSFYKRHRNILNVAMGTGAGALVGGLIGGRRGVGIGMLAGGGGTALWTYKLRKRHHNNYRTYRNY